MSTVTISGVWAWLFMAAFAAFWFANGYRAGRGKR